MEMVFNLNLTSSVGSAFVHLDGDMAPNTFTIIIHHYYLQVSTLSIGAPQNLNPRAQSRGPKPPQPPRSAIFRAFLTLISIPHIAITKQEIAIKSSYEESLHNDLQILPKFTAKNGVFTCESIPLCSVASPPSDTTAIFGLD